MVQPFHEWRGAILHTVAPCPSSCSTSPENIPEKSAVTECIRWNKPRTELTEMLALPLSSTEPLKAPLRLSPKGKEQIVKWRMHAIQQDFIAWSNPDREYLVHTARLLERFEDRFDFFTQAGEISGKD